MIGRSAWHRFRSLPLAARAWKTTLVILPLLGLVHLVGLVVGLSLAFGPSAIPEILLNLGPADWLRAAFFVIGVPLLEVGVLWLLGWLVVVALLRRRGRSST